ncbi:aldose 1-epimerase [Collibacillus ludicampi]|uniref:Aldose 1-epimerase n=1 Tax=Collibacillus ludicampi TaxID=2771369 RepID=A0AAV4LBN9_9BACL|nr:aldose 1-epimerase [Collibacillus ludicampi]GIM45116.1 aldose 1-epimerase [Collibacillus ludicampi]
MATAYVENMTYLGEPAIRAGNERMEIILVPGWGSNLISIFHKEKNASLLRTPKSREEFWENPVLYGTPILFPPNRIGDGRFTFNGRTYHFDMNEKDKRNHLHGFLYREKWERVRAEVKNDRVVLETEIDSTVHPEIVRQFPHPFTVRMTYLLEGERIQQNATILNRDKEAFPWGLGYHTTFLFPEDACTFSLTAEKRWILNERLLPTGELEEIEDREQWQKGIRLKERALDDAFLSSASPRGRNEAVIANERLGLRITYWADENFKHWVVYNADGKQGFVCPEPYTWVTNAPHLDLPPSLTGLRVLAPGEQITIKTGISVSVDSRD